MRKKCQNTLDSVKVYNLLLMIQKGVACTLNGGQPVVISAILVRLVGTLLSISKTFAD